MCAGSECFVHMPCFRCEVMIMASIGEMAMACPGLKGLSDCLNSASSVAGMPCVVSTRGLSRP